MGVSGALIPEQVPVAARQVRGSKIDVWSWIDLDFISTFCLLHTCYWFIDLYCFYIFYKKQNMWLLGYVSNVLHFMYDHFMLFLICTIWYLLMIVWILQSLCWLLLFVDEKWLWSTCLLCMKYVFNECCNVFFKWYLWHFHLFHLACISIYC